MSDLAGRDLTENMKRLVGEKGINCSSYDESVFMEMKEKLCYVAFDYENELNCTIFSTQLLDNREPKIKHMISLTVRRYRWDLR